LTYSSRVASGCISLVPSCVVKAYLTQCSLISVNDEKTMAGWKARVFGR
jgi:hypothetical protein